MESLFGFNKDEEDSCKRVKRLYFWIWIRDIVFIFALMGIFGLTLGFIIGNATK